MFNKLAEKLTGKGMEDCVLQKHVSRNKLYELVDKVKEREAAINPSFRDKDHVLQGLHRDLNEARISYAIAEATYEKAKAEQAGLISLVGLLSASMQAGKETNEIEAAIASVIGYQLTGTSVSNGKIERTTPADHRDKVEDRDNDGSGSGVFLILETRESSPGTVRAFAEAEDGSRSKHAIYAKNGMGQKLNQAKDLSKSVFVKYRQGDKGLIAYGVEIIG